MNDSVKVPFNLSIKQYSYLVLFLNCLAIISTTPGHSFGINMFIENWKKDFNTNSLVINSIWTVASLISGVFVINLGKVIDKLGAKKVLNILYPLYILCLFLIGFSGNIYILGTLICFMRILGPESIGTISYIILCKWFSKNKGKVFSLLAFLDTIFIISPAFINILIEQFNWRITYLILASIIFIFLLPNIILISDSPEKYGLQISNENQDSDNDKAYKDIIKDVIYWLIILNNFVFGFFWSGFNINATDIFYLNANFSKSNTANLIFIPITIGVLIGSFLIGILIDKINNKYKLFLFSFCFFMFSLIIYLYTIISNSLTIIVNSFIYGVFIGINVTNTSVLLPCMYGYKDLAKIQSLHNGLILFSTGTGSLLFSFIKYLYGNYNFIFYLISLLLCFDSLLIFFVTIKKNL